jgi:hypothetical protein
MAFRRLDAQGWKMVLQVHDFVGIEYPLERKAECYAAIQEAFNIPLTLNGKTFIIPLDIKAGPNWRDMKPVVVEDGINTVDTRSVDDSGRGGSTAIIGTQMVRC